MRKLLTILLTGVSMLVCVAAVWLWIRSYSTVDIISRDTAGDKVNICRGVGSFNGAVIVGKLDLPWFRALHPEINYQTHEVEQNRTRVKTAMASDRGVLGFGVADGKIQLPILGSVFRTAPLPFHVVYLPYYVLVLAGSVLPLWRLRGLLRQGPRSEESPSSVDAAADQMVV